MNCIPARVAGVDEVVVTCPTPDGTPDPVVLAACHLVGADRLVTAVGAHIRHPGDLLIEAVEVGRGALGADVGDEAGLAVVLVDDLAHDQVTLAHVAVLRHPALAGIPGPVLPDLQPRAGDPVAGERVQVLVDPGNDPSVLELPAVASDVDPQRVEVVRLREDVLVVVVDQVGRRLQGGGGGERPARAIPLAVVPLVGELEPGVTLLGGRELRTLIGTFKKGEAE